MQLIVSLFKWILSLNQLVWFGVGGISFSVLTFLHMKMKQNEKKSKLGFTCIIFSVFSFAFSILWTYDSFLENEVRAASMGIMIFGGLGIVLALLAFKIYTKNSSKEVKVKA